jgi:ubiquinone biosynthesis protein
MNPLGRVSRSARVLSTAAIIYAGYKWTGLRNRKATAEAAALRDSSQHRKSAERFFKLATGIRGLMIKSGQVMGARADLFPDEYVEVLSRLHDDVPPRSFAEIRTVVDAELGQPLEEVFQDFEKIPVASASLAQVHRATLPDGRRVAVKIQYPDIQEIVKVDLANIRRIARVAGRVWLRDIDLNAFVQELEFAVSQELDFIKEGHNAERVGRDFATEDNIVVPTIVWEHSSRRVLVMEYVDGVKSTDLAGLEAIGVSTRQVMEMITDFYMQQLLLNGFFHADPHPGNIFIQPGPRLVMLDFGLCKELSLDFRRNYVALTWAMATGDKVAVGHALREIGFSTRNDDPTTLETLGEIMTSRMSDTTTPRRELTIQMNNEMMAVVRDNPVAQIPIEFLLIGRVMGLISGLGARLGVALDITPQMVHYVGRAQATLARDAEAVA